LDAADWYFHGHAQIHPNLDNAKCFPGDMFAMVLCPTANAGMDAGVQAWNDVMSVQLIRLFLLFAVPAILTAAIGYFTVRVLKKIYE
jgi:hypothetical protein